MPPTESLIVGTPYTTDNVIRGLQRPVGASVERLRAPDYRPPPDAFAKARAALAVPSMRHHMTDEGWQIMLALKSAGYSLYGHGIEGGNTVDVREVLRLSDPSTVLVQDEREWRGLTTGKGFDRRETFQHSECLCQREDIFKLTILKDSHQNPPFHSESAVRMGVHAWVVYYHPGIISHLAPYVRPEHLVRTYHSLDSELVTRTVPSVEGKGRRDAVISGAVSGAYPLRQKIIANLDKIEGLHHLPHPGYHRHGPNVEFYLRHLSGFKVSLCTASKYGYALRKIVESTAAGCRVITDLPCDEKMPGIEANLVRVRPDISVPDLVRVVAEVAASYDEEFQREMSYRATRLYDYRFLGAKLALDIEWARASYNQGEK